MSESKEFYSFLNDNIFPFISENVWKGQVDYDISFFREVVEKATEIKTYNLFYTPTQIESNSTYTIYPYSDLPFQEDSRNGFAPILRLLEFRDIQFFSVLSPFFVQTPYQFILTKKGELTKLVSLYQEEEKLDDEKIKVIGTRHLLLEQEVMDFLTNKEFHTYCQDKGIRVKKGICLQGEPGNGKTLSLRYVKRRCQQEKIYFRQFESAKDFVENKDEIGKHERAVFVFEDFDSFAMEREAESGPNGILGLLLNTLDGVDTIDNVVTLFTTNHITKIDSAMLRPGRIDKVFVFDNPSDEEIKDFFETYLTDYSEYYENMLTRLRSRTSYKPGFSHIKGICDTINIECFYNNLQKLSEERVLEIIDESIEQKAKLVKDGRRMGF